MFLNGLHMMSMYCVGPAETVIISTYRTPLSDFAVLMEIIPPCTGNRLVPIKVETFELESLCQLASLTLSHQAATTRRSQSALLFSRAPYDRHKLRNFRIPVTLD